MGGQLGYLEQQPVAPDAHAARHDEVVLLGVIGGSGLYGLDGLRHPRWERVPSGFGSPSSEVLLGELDGHQAAFLPRHGPGHRLAPNDINYRANIEVLKQVGVTDLLSVNAVGSLREELPPGTMVLVDQFIDRTTQRVNSFFGGGVVAHVSMADPVCARLSDAIARAADQIPVVRGGTCVVIEGPQFSTRAESQLYQGWGADLVGMTALPEARLAREAELCYAVLALVTDYDCWHSGHASVTVGEVMATMAANVGAARTIIQRLPAQLPVRGDCGHGCDRALEAAIVTPPDSRDPAVVEQLRTVAGRVLPPDLPA